MAAVNFHKQTHNVPGISLRWKAASAINLGVAIRESAINAQSQHVLEDALLSILQGVSIKLEIGDLDEAAVGLHNAAICQILIYSRDEVSNRTHMCDSLEMSELGLKILDVTKANKKRGMLLAESCIAFRELLSSTPILEGMLEEFKVRLVELRHFYADLGLSDTDVTEILGVAKTLATYGEVSAFDDFLKILEDGIPKSDSN
jgi:hypothetical protein